jgi:hypothetical protein
VSGPAVAVRSDRLCPTPDAVTGTMSMSAAASLRAVLVSVLVARGSMQTRGKCIINFVGGCRLHPGYGAVHDDNAAAYTDFGVGASAERCLARSKEYFEWCGNTDHTEQIRWQPC